MFIKKTHWQTLDACLLAKRAICVFSLYRKCSSGSCLGTVYFGTLKDQGIDPRIVCCLGRVMEEVQAMLRDEMSKFRKEMMAQMGV